MSSVASFDDPTRTVEKIDYDAVGASLREGWADFLARPTTGIFLIVIYPFIGLILYRFAFDEALLPLLFPIASGFALVGPITAVGLYEISRRRERQANVDGVDAYAGLSGEQVVPVLLVGLLLLVVYAAWIGVAQTIYGATMGAYIPTGIGDLVARVFTTAEGWTLLIVGCGVGFLFALAVLAIGSMSLPAIFDRRLGAAEAIALSIRAFAANPGPMLAWGFIVAAGLVLGSVPAFLGLLVVLPVFGHATWHLYRRVVRRPG